MSDIFISYASVDRPRVKPLVDALQQQGWSVWWDRTILAGKTFDRAIEIALKDSRCVIVLWSRDSIESHWVRTEADEGRRRGILVPAMLDDVPIPLGFRIIHAANLIGWSGELPGNQLDELTRAVSDVLSNSITAHQDSRQQQSKHPNQQTHLEGPSSSSDDPTYSSRRIAERTDLDAPIISTTLSKKTGEVEKEQTHLTLKLMAIVVSGVVLLLIVFSLFWTPNKKTGQEAENMIINCDPECSTDTNFALSVSSAGPKNLRGRVQLAALLPQPTALKCWRWTVDGNSIDSGTGVKDFTSGDVFEDFNIRGIHPLGFNSFHRLSGDVLGISVSSYNVFAFTLLENSNTGAFSIQPITFSQFNRMKSCETESPEGAKGFPRGTIFFAFMADGTQVVNQTPLNAIVVVR